MIRSFLFFVAAGTMTVALSGCGGDSTPEPISAELEQEIQQQDEQVFDEESEL